MFIKKADHEDLNIILDIYDGARRFMRKVGNPRQWGNAYPSVDQITADISAGKQYVVIEDGDILATFFFDIFDDPTYAVIFDGAWLNDAPCGVIHRLAVSDTSRGKGVAGHCFEYAFAQCRNLKIDTHIDNLPMQRSLEKNGFVRCGRILLANGESRTAFQRTEIKNEQ